MKKPFVSVQILNYNGKKFLKECFDSLIKQNYPRFEVVLVDNGSTDDSIKFMEKRYAKEIRNKKLRIQKLEKNFGVTGGYNRSFKKTKADYIFIIGNDTIVPEKNFLTTLVNAAIKNKSALTSGWDYPVDIKKFKKKIFKNCDYPMISLLGFCVAYSMSENKSTLAGGGCLLIDKKQITEDRTLVCRFAINNMPAP